MTKSSTGFGTIVVENIRQGPTMKHMIQILRAGIGTLLIALSLPIQAQELNGRLGLGFHMGATNFIGDVSTHEFWPSLSNPNEVRFAGGLQVTYAVNPFLSFRYHWTNGKLFGANMQHMEQFSTVFNEHSLHALINLTSIFYYDPDKSNLEIYGILGYGINSFRSALREYPNGNILNTFGYGSDGIEKLRPTRELSIPLGFSVRTRMDRWIPVYAGFLASDLMELSIDVTWHFVNTDKLDAKITGSGKDNFVYIALGFGVFLFD